MGTNNNNPEFPTYRQVWSAPGTAIWQPRPPPGYLALGQVATCDQDVPPPLDEIGCLHSNACVESTQGQQLALHEGEAGPGSQPLVVQCGDNSVASFCVALGGPHGSPQTHNQGEARGGKVAVNTLQTEVSSF